MSSSSKYFTYCSDVISRLGTHGDFVFCGIEGIHEKCNLSPFDVDKEFINRSFEVSAYFFSRDTDTSDIFSSEDGVAELSIAVLCEISQEYFPKFELDEALFLKHLRNYFSKKLRIQTLILHKMIYK